MKIHHHSQFSFKRPTPVRFAADGYATARVQPVTHVEFPSATSNATEDIFSQIWTPGLLDRLEAPLTRHHE